MYWYILCADDQCATIIVLRKFPEGCVCVIPTPYYHAMERRGGGSSDLKLPPNHIFFFGALSL